jgi:hypothetical protein
MFTAAEKDLTMLLSQQVYPALLEAPAVGGPGTTIPTYQSLVTNGKPAPERCAAAARAIVSALAAAGGVREAGATAKLWHTPLCRVLGAAGSNSMLGRWWFDASLVRRWEQVHSDAPPGKRRDLVLASLRPMLAISHNWNDMLRIEMMTPPAPGFPVIAAPGMHQSTWSEKHAKHDPKVVFIGGFQQVYVPYVPPGLIRPYG